MKNLEDRMAVNGWSSTVAGSKGLSREQLHEGVAESLKKEFFWTAAATRFLRCGGANALLHHASLGRDTHPHGLAPFFGSRVFGPFNESLRSVGLGILRRKVGHPSSCAGGMASAASKRRVV